MYDDAHEHPQRFNPRARVGRDSMLAQLRASLRRFQSTRPRGARRRLRCDRLMLALWFQSTRPRGARLLDSLYGVSHSACVSIHAPAWGATLSRRSAAFDASRFNPRARVGRDRTELHSSISAQRCFNPRARVGRDACCDARSTSARARRFNPRARVGRDRS